MGWGRITARQLWIVAESVHAVTYFAPGCRLALREGGLKGFWSGYFAARAAPLGPVGAETVCAAFFNFAPAMVQRAVPSCWDAADPAELTVRRATAAATALTELCATDSLHGLVDSLPTLQRISAHCAREGGIMTAANSVLWPSVAARWHGRSPRPEPSIGVGEGWQACTTLREHRGDGHVVSLVTQGLGGLDAHLLAAGVRGVPAGVLRDSRGWTTQDWQEGSERLADRGLLGPDGLATANGIELHRAVEEMTDQRAERVLATLADGEMATLHAALLRCAGEIQAWGVLPFPNPMGLPAL